MLESEANRLASLLFSGDLSPEEEQATRARLESEEQGRAALDRMQATVSALRAWPDSLPRVRVPEQRRPARRRWLVLAPLAAAAAALFLATQVWFAPHDEVPHAMPPAGGQLTKGPSQPAPRAEPGWAEREFAFLLSRKPGGTERGGDPGGKQGGKGKFGEPPGGGGLPGGKTGGTDGGLGGGPSGSKGGNNPYRGLVDFDFELPARLPGNYQLKDGKAVSKDVLRLTYLSGLRRLVVHLKKSSGPDAPVEPLLDGQILAARRRDVALAVEGADLNFELVDQLLKLFVPEKKEADPGLE